MAKEPTNEDHEKGRKLLTAVERLVASSAKIRAVADECLEKADGDRTAAAVELVRHYSNRAAIAGGAAGLPMLIPGPQTLLIGLGATLAELGVLLKFEVEMALALSHLYDFDIDEPEERQLAFLLASVGTYDASGGNFFTDVVKAEGVAIWNYAPRKVGKMLIQAMTALALMYIWRGFAKLIPVVGVVLGASLNKVLTRKVGQRCARDLQARRELVKQKARSEKKAQSAARRPAARRARPVRGVKAE